jgi:hypothetical protein
VASVVLGETQTAYSLVRLPAAGSIESFTIGQVSELIVAS